MKNKNAGCVYGYVRVSSADQNEERQRIAMAQEGLKEKDIFMDKQSGKDFDRPAYRRLLHVLREGDILVVKSIDRLGRDYEEIIEQWRCITKEIKADIKVIDMPLLDTTLSKDLLGTFIADLVLQVLSFAAENERENIRQRQREGIDAALARGVRFGRPGIPDSEAMLEAVRLYRQKKISLSRALDMSGIGKTTFYKKLKEFSA
ncbi:MAG: recombinase family protein [Clostridia bacterium]